MDLSTDIEKPPLLPKLLTLPFKLFPSTVHSNILVSFLNLILKNQVLDGDLDFLNNRRLRINVRDLNISYNISLKKNRLISISGNNESDIKIQANIYDFLQLAARQQDPDTLVFQRRLIMQGNTELGLELKNFLDGLDLESQGSFVKIESFLLKGLPVYKRLFS